MSSVRKFNFWEKAAFKEMGKLGLTSKMIRDRNDSGYKFDCGHYFALRNLVKDRGFSVAAALAEIDGLSGAQAGGIKEGLCREDVIHLSNFWHISALEELKKHGMTADMLLMRNNGGCEFNENHCFALRNLVKDRGFSVAAALAEIDGLSGAQAGGIEEGLCREDVINLTNFWHISALKELKKHGLTADMLLYRNRGGYKFDYNHCYALQDLVEKHGLSVKDALTEMSGTSSAEAARIRKEGPLPKVTIVSHLSFGIFAINKNRMTAMIMEADPVIKRQRIL